MKSGDQHYAEVLRAYDLTTNTAYVALNGQLKLLSCNDAALTLQQQGPFPPVEDRLFQSFPGWQDAYRSWQQQAMAANADPDLADVASAEVVHSLAQLQQDVSTNPAFWCDGIGPNDPPLTPLQQDLLYAGELLAFEAGFRGICLVQLHVGWNRDTRQPALRPYVPTLLHRISANKDITVTMSPAPGDLGLTAVLAARKEPWSSWAAHLVGFGAQASVVAQSPYYKLLIGRMLGYREDNIRHHIQAGHGEGQPSVEVVQAATEELKKLSPKAPQLPWTGAGKVGGRRKKGQAAAAKR